MLSWVGFDNRMLKKSKSCRMSTKGMQRGKALNTDTLGGLNLAVQKVGGGSWVAFFMSM